jgi:hypothetical protein
MNTLAEVVSSYKYQRYWILHELCRLRASARNGANVNKERRELQKSLGRVRKMKYVVLK